MAPLAAAGGGGMDDGGVDIEGGEIRKKNQFMLLG